MHINNRQADVDTSKLLVKTMDKKNKLELKYHLIAGIGAGLVASISTYPLDMLKTRYQGIIVKIFSIILSLLVPQIPFFYFFPQNQKFNTRGKQPKHGITNLFGEPCDRF